MIWQYNVEVNGKQWQQNQQVNDKSDIIALFCY